MTQCLCNIKMSGTNCITKKYRVPFFYYVLKDKTVLKYMDRPARCKSLTLTEYSRYQQHNFFTKILSTLFAIHIFYLHSVIHLMKQNNKHMSHIFYKIILSTYFLAKFLTLSISHIQFYSICETILTTHVSLCLEKSNLSMFFH